MNDPVFGSVWHPMKMSLGDDGDKGKTLTLEMAGQPDFVVKIWYDPKTYAPLRRSIADKNGPEMLIETYTDLSVNLEIPDEVFKTEEK